MFKNGIDRNRIKYIALIAMLIDHFAMFFLSHSIAQASVSRIALYSFMRVIGRLTAPIMLYFLVEGFIHTSSRKKYGVRLFAFGVISQIPYALANHNSLLKFDLNMIFTLFVIFLMLLAQERSEERPQLRIVVFLLIMSTFCCDWGVLGPFMAWLFYRFRDDKDKQIKYYCMICAIQVVSAAVFLASNGKHWYGELWQAGMFMMIPFIRSYNGKPGNKSSFNKWVFYIFYPLHLLIIWVIKYKI